MNKRYAGLLFLISPVVAGSSVHAATIMTDMTDAACALTDAMSSANTDTATAGCSAGEPGLDVIELKSALILTEEALPEITSEITVNGNGNIVKPANDPTVGAALRVADTGQLTLNEVTVTCSAKDFSGLVANHGTLTLHNSAVSGNMADFADGWIYNYGTMTLNKSTISVNSTSVGSSNISNFGTFMLTDSSICGNSGRIYNKGTFTLTRSAITGHETDSANGGMYNYGTFTLTESTVSVNATELSVNPVATQKIMD